MPLVFRRLSAGAHRPIHLIMNDMFLSLYGTCVTIPQHLNFLTSKMTPHKITSSKQFYMWSYRIMLASLMIS